MSTTSSATEDLLDRGVSETINRASLVQRLGRRRPLRIKFGIDPTAHQIHLGHVVPLRKLRAWQAAGHAAVLVVGDFTARIGDPSGRDKERLALSAEQTKKFAASYLEQIGQVIDIRRAEVRYNSEWFDHMTTGDFLRLLSKTTLNQLLAHETFSRRLDAKRPLGLHEITYPILQGYDSVAVKADVELGGLDQKFNLLTGRDIQQAYGQEPQEIVMFEYLLGTDGKQKMSKSLGNTINLTDTAQDMYGKIMSIPDKLIPQYFTLATELPAGEIQDIIKELRSKKAHPKNTKGRLAMEIVRLYHGEDAAETAAAEFTKVFSKKGLPTDLPKIAIRAGAHPVLNLLVSQKLAASRSEARRLVEQGGVKLNKETLTDWNATITIREGDVLQIGKRTFVRFTVS